MFFKKRKSKVYCVTEGTVYNISNVSDDMFSTKMLGDGYAVKDYNGCIYAPIDGVIQSVFQTKHAITIRSKCGIDILLHIGIDTVNLKGEPFEILISEQDEVHCGQLIANVNIKAIEDNGLCGDVIVVFPEYNEYKHFEIIKDGTATISDVIVTINK